MDYFSAMKELHFSFLRKTSRTKINFDSPGYDTVPWGVSFYEPKNRITHRILNQNQKYFNPLVGGPGRFEL